MRVAQVDGRRAGEAFGEVGQWKHLDLTTNAKRANNVADSDPADAGVSGVSANLRAGGRRRGAVAILGVCADAAFSSISSPMCCLPWSVAPVRMSVRIARATRPWRPITLPRSSPLTRRAQHGRVAVVADHTHLHRIWIIHEIAREKFDQPLHGDITSCVA